MTPSSPPPPQLSSWPRITTKPRLVASTGSAYHGPVSATTCLNESLQHTAATPPHCPTSNESNLFKSAQWTADGTTLLTHSEDDGIRTFILPPDLLDKVETNLKPYNTTFTPSRVYATALYPFASLSSPETFIYLCSPWGGPIRLHSLLHPALLSSYQLVNPHTETHDAPYSLLIRPNTPNTFLAGSSSQISIFDLNRSGSGPTTVLKTIPTRRTPATTTTMKGLVMALALSDGVLAAGTNTRQVGLYAGDGGGEIVGVFTLPEDDDAGGGVTRLLWSPCGRYLYIAERRCDVVSVYDIRVTGLRVESLRGRRAETNQRVDVDIATGLGGEVVGGGTDGVVRIWEGKAEGSSSAGDCVGSWQAHDDVVTSAVVHPFGSVVATCSGSRKTFGLGRRAGDNSSNEDSDEDQDEAAEGLWDNSLKIWEIPSPQTSDP